MESDKVSFEVIRKVSTPGTLSQKQRGSRTGPGEALAAWGILIETWVSDGPKQHRFRAKSQVAPIADGLVAGLGFDHWL